MTYHVKFGNEKIKISWWRGFFLWIYCSIVEKYLNERKNFRDN